MIPPSTLSDFDTGSLDLQFDPLGIATCDEAVAFTQLADAIIQFKCTQRNLRDRTTAAATAAPRPPAATPRATRDRTSSLSPRASRLRDLPVLPFIPVSFPDGVWSGWESAWPLLDDGFEVTPAFVQDKVERFFWIAWGGFTPSVDAQLSIARFVSALTLSPELVHLWFPAWHPVAVFTGGASLHINERSEEVEPTVVEDVALPEEAVRLPSLALQKFASRLHAGMGLHDSAADTVRALVDENRAAAAMKSTMAAARLALEQSDLGGHGRLSAPSDFATEMHARSQRAARVAKLSNVPHIAPLSYSEHIPSARRPQKPALAQTAVSSKPQPREEPVLAAPLLKQVAAVLSPAAAAAARPVGRDSADSASGAVSGVADKGQAKEAALPSVHKKLLHVLID